MIPFTVLGFSFGGNTCSPRVLFDSAIIPQINTFHKKQMLTFIQIHLSSATKAFVLLLLSSYVDAKKQHFVYLDLDYFPKIFTRLSGTVH